MGSLCIPKMASRSLRLSSSYSSSPYCYLFNRVKYSSAAAAAPSQTPGPGKEDHMITHEHIKAPFHRSKCIPISNVIAFHKRKTGRDDIDMDYLVAQAKRGTQLYEEMNRKADELKEKEFGNNRKKNDKLLREMLRKMMQDDDNNNK